MHIIQFSYNLNEESLPPAVVHDGRITDTVQERYEGRLAFVETEDGNIDYNTIGQCFMNIYK